MKVHVFDTKEKLYDEVSNYYIERLNKNPNLNLGLATGTTPIPLYDRLIEAYKKGLVSFKGVKAFNLDEYLGLEKNHHQSYYYFMRNQLFNHIDINQNNCFIPSGDNPDHETAKKEYQELLKQNQVDIQLLGIGSNGHIGFNEPNTPFDTKTHVVKLDEKTRIDNSRLFNSLDEVPTHAITMGISEIMNAKEIIVIATGSNKKDAVYEMIKGNISENVPASVLQRHPNVTVYIDKDAASRL
ncbi:glucosamine-6-phosphate deaminase [Acholeplasma equifetale]|uniref:glucosamine-6-phosphate deaminase n=1 Tax=Acholeplasma equifetale TaxID=264634 RepID=UPI00047BB18A|nr:glucosamine-6-phosphate deaminase [Acholeplasma equifetale]